VKTENVEVLNGALFITQDAAARVRPLRSRTGRSPWSFPSLNLSRSYNQLATVWRRIEILYASSGDRICLFRGEIRRRKVEGRIKKRRALCRDNLGCGSGKRISFLILR
jgi:hypothetical protein